MVAQTLRMGQGRRIYRDLDPVAGTLVQGTVERYPGRPRGSIERNTMEGQTEGVQESWPFSRSRRQGVLGLHVPKPGSGNSGRRRGTDSAALRVVNFVTITFGELIDKMTRPTGQRRDMNVITLNGHTWYDL